jgi:hypothetical protein
MTERVTKNQHLRKYSPALHAQIVENIRKGQPKRIAFSVARVNPQTVWDWLAQGKRFPNTYPEYVRLAEDIEQAQDEAIADRLALIQAAAESDPKNWTAAAWQLERMHPDQFGRRDRVEVEASRPIAQVNQLILADASTRELSRQLLHRVASGGVITEREQAQLEAGPETEDEPSISAPSLRTPSPKTDRVSPRSPVVVRDVYERL